ncbi:hypothetical protein MAM1_0257d08824 [Mucor ambiguus]|uniref:Protein kinase domain-containing protein n=1 Tax=Mucor ambiguus TaxID=91626 RepID=A0A0C9MPD4_9FUNG|nr:hypothetical protein MAM1_0257d08824 [Mucor ambiguus]
MTSSNRKIKPHAKKRPVPTSDQDTLCRNCRKDATVPNQTIDTSITPTRHSTTTLTDHKLALFESAPVELIDVEYKDVLMAKNQCIELNTNWKRVREDKPEIMEDWIQNKKSNTGKGLVEPTPSTALQQAGVLAKDLEIAESSQSTTTTNKKNSSENRKFRSKSAIKALSSGPSTPISTAENVDTTAHTKKDVDSLNVGKNRRRRSASRACNSGFNESSVITLTALLHSADKQAHSETIVSFQNGPLQRGELDPKELQISETVLGEGQLGIVRLGLYRGLYVACKSKRLFTRSDAFHSQAKREMMFAAKLAACRYINRYIGWIFCRRELLERSSVYSKHKPYLYILQRYVPNGDARAYLEKRETSFKPQEVLQASICLFAALTDAHALNIGIVDLKLENFLIDSSGAGWLTDFGSCIEFKEGSETADLDEEKVAWTEHVAPPEMLQKHTFTKASDVFMATLIVAELMTADISDVDFQNNILQRCAKTGKVSFSSAPINPVYNNFFTLLKMGLHNNSNQRPTAKATLDYLLLMKA